MTPARQCYFACSPVQARLLQDGLKTAHVVPVSAEDIITAACPLQRFDLSSMMPQDADFSAPFTLQALPSVRMCFTPPLGLTPLLCSQ